MAYRSVATPTEPSPLVVTPATHPTVASLPTAHIDPFMYGLAPSDPTLAAVASSVPEGIITLHTTADHQRLELDSLLVDLPTRLFAPDTQIAEVTHRLQLIAYQRRPLLEERDSTRRAHTASTFERA